MTNLHTEAAEARARAVNYSGAVLEFEERGDEVPRELEIEAALAIGRADGLRDALELITQHGATE